jgi:hypothetical protein
MRPKATTHVTLRERIFPFGFLLSLQAKPRLEMAKDNPDALSHALCAKDHAFDRERDGKIPASSLKSHGRSPIKFHLHQETKFWGGEYDQRGPLRRRHVLALTHLSIGKEADHIEENEFIGEGRLRSSIPSSPTSASSSLISSSRRRSNVSVCSETS